jgi:hypothetical protein
VEFLGETLPLAHRGQAGFREYPLSATRWRGALRRVPRRASYEDARGRSGRDQPFAGALVALEYLFAVELKKAVPAKDVFRCLGFVLGMS